MVLNTEVVLSKVDCTGSNKNILATLAEQASCSQ